MSETYDYTMFIEMEHIRGFVCAQSPEEMKRILVENPREYLQILATIMEAMLAEKEIDITKVVIVAGETNDENSGEMIFNHRTDVLYDNHKLLEKAVEDRKDFRLPTEREMTLGDFNIETEETE